MAADRMRSVSQPLDDGRLRKRTGTETGTEKARA